MTHTTSTNTPARRSPRTLRLEPLVTLACLLLALPASAVDGVIEINQASALAGAVTPGDAAGFPVTITEPGSYRLTGSLIVPDGTTTAVLFSAGGIEFDLNGFEITCADPCAGSTGRGIDTVLALGNWPIKVRNGRIRGMGDTAIVLIGLSSVEDMILIDNGGSGIESGDAMTVRNCTVRANGGNGINASANSVIQGNSVAHNTGDGIFAEFGSVISGNTANDNTSEGIRCSSDCNVFGNTAVRNDVGMAGSGLFRDNVATQNTSFGIDIGNDSGYGGNVLHGNNSPGGPQVDGGVDLGGNACGTSTVCP